MTELQRRFIAEYMVDGNARQAAIRAGYSPRSADQTAQALLHKPKYSAVQEAVARARAERDRRCGVSADRIMTELARIAFCDTADVIDFESGGVRQDASEDETRCIAEYQVRVIPRKVESEDGELETIQVEERRVKVADKLKALDKLAQLMGLYDRSGKAADGDGKQTGVVLLPAVEPLEGPAGGPAEGDSDGD